MSEIMRGEMDMPGKPDWHELLGMFTIRLFDRERDTGSPLIAVRGTLAVVTAQVQPARMTAMVLMPWGLMVGHRRNDPNVSSVIAYDGKDDPRVLEGEVAKPYNVLGVELHSALNAEPEDDAVINPDSPQGRILHDNFRDGLYFNRPAMNIALQLALPPDSR